VINDEFRSRLARITALVGNVDDSNRDSSALHVEDSSDRLFQLSDEQVAEVVDHTHTERSTTKSSSKIGKNDRSRRKLNQARNQDDIDRVPSIDDRTAVLGSLLQLISHLQQLNTAKVSPIAKEITAITNCVPGQTDSEERTKYRSGLGF
jgi:hypothetical protein